MLRAVVVLLYIGLTLYSILDAARCDPRTVRGAPRWLWLVVIVVVPLAGALAWLFAGRPRPDAATATRTSRGPNRPAASQPRPVLGPDDDPEFLGDLHRRQAREAREARQARRRDEAAGSPGGEDPGEAMGQGGTERR